MKYSIILVNYSKLESSCYGVYSWLLQKFKYDYEVLLLHCTNYTKPISFINDNRVSNCRFKTFEIKKPNIFNLAAFRNLGASYSSGDRLIFASVDIIRKNDFLKNVDEYTPHDCWVSMGSYHITEDYRKYLKKIEKYNNENNCNYNRY